MSKLINPIGIGLTIDATALYISCFSAIYDITKNKSLDDEEKLDEIYEVISKFDLIAEAGGGLTVEDDE